LRRIEDVDRAADGGSDVRSQEIEPVDGERDVLRFGQSRGFCEHDALVVEVDTHEFEPQIRATKGDRHRRSRTCR
jgi:hypothetical protein